MHFKNNNKKNLFTFNTTNNFSMKRHDKSLSWNSYALLKSSIFEDSLSFMTKQSFFFFLSNEYDDKKIMVLCVGKRQENSKSHIQSSDNFISCPKDYFAEFW